MPVSPGYGYPATQAPAPAVPAARVRWEQPHDLAPAARHRGGAGLAVLVGALVAVLLLGAGAAGWFLFLQPEDETTTSADDGSGAGEGALGGRGGAPAPVQPLDEEAGDATVDPPPDEEEPESDPAPSTTSSVDPEEEAVATLDDLAYIGAASVPLDGRWVAQLSSKSVGTTDPLQIARNGSNTFYGTDILYEHDELRDAVGSSANVFVLYSTHFGRHSTDDANRPYWVTLADGGFGSREEVDAFCRQTFPTYTAAELANACAPRTLEPSHP